MERRTWIGSIVAWIVGIANLQVFAPASEDVPANDDAILRIPSWEAIDKADRERQKKIDAINALPEVEPMDVVTNVTFDGTQITMDFRRIYAIPASDAMPLTPSQVEFLLKQAVDSINDSGT